MDFRQDRHETSWERIDICAIKHCAFAWCFFRAIEECLLKYQKTSGRSGLKNCVLVLWALLMKQKKYMATLTVHVILRLSSEWDTIVLQSADGNTHFLRHFAHCHKPLWNCSVFCHICLPPMIYYVSLRYVTNKTFFTKICGRDLSLPLCLILLSDFLALAFPLMKEQDKGKTV